MIDRRIVASLVALVLGATLPLACTSQTVDAVEIERRLDSDGDVPDAGADQGADADANTGTPEGGEPPDTDGDGTPDPEDGCLTDEKKIVPGTCGCNVPDPEVDGGPNCLDLAAALAHRYTFIGASGTDVVVDSKAGADGQLVNATLSGEGSAVLAGAASDQYVDLPNGLLSSLTSATLEGWVRWQGGAEWQRIFDFGNNNAATEGQQGATGTTYLFMTARTEQMDELRFQTGKLRVSYKGPGTDNREAFVEAEVALPAGVPETMPPTHVAVVIDAVARTMSVYVNGERQEGRAMYGGTIAMTVPPTTKVPYELVNEHGPYDWSMPLADGGMPPPAVDLTTITDVNNWLGRSQWRDDVELAATYYEFRIYREALSETLLGISFAAGPDPGFLPKPQ